MSSDIDIECVGELGDRLQGLPVKYASTTAKDE
jgi:hypothetical protein